MPKASVPSIVGILGGIAIASASLLGPVLREVDVGATKVKCGGAAIQAMTAEAPRSLLKLEHEAYASCKKAATHQILVGLLVGSAPLLVGILDVVRQRVRRPRACQQAKSRYLERPKIL